MVKTYIISTHFNRTDFIDLQFKTIKKFFKGDYEFIVINDGKPFGDHSNNGDAKWREKIQKKCFELGVKCINIPQKIHSQRNIIFPNTVKPNCHDPSCRHTTAVQYAQNYILNNYKEGYLLNLDSDMFFIKEFDIVSIMKNCNFMLKYLKIIDNNNKIFDYHAWAGLFVLDIGTLPNLKELIWDCGKIGNYNVDSGGQSYHYLQNYKDNLKITQIHQTKCPDNIEECRKNIKDPRLLELLNSFCNLRNDKKAHKEFFFNDSIIHLRSGGEWDRNRDRNYFNHSLKLLYKYLNL